MEYFNEEHMSDKDTLTVRRILAQMPSCIGRIRVFFKSSMCMFFVSVLMSFSQELLCLMPTSNIGQNLTQKQIYQWFVHCLFNFAFFQIPYQWNHKVCNFLTCTHSPILLLVSIVNFILLLM